tara:strand:+ start:42559 stop:45267 length:2709 start_codon:yes stop_codon:yes gene_type:complete
MVNPVVTRKITNLFNRLPEEPTLKQSLNQGQQVFTELETIFNFLESNKPIFENELDWDLFCLMVGIQQLSLAIAKDVAEGDKPLEIRALQIQAIKEFCEHWPLCNAFPKDSVVNLLTNDSLDYYLNQHEANEQASLEHIAKTSIAFGLTDAQMFDVIKQLQLMLFYAQKKSKTNRFGESMVLPAFTADQEVRLAKIEGAHNLIFKGHLVLNQLSRQIQTGKYNVKELYFKFTNNIEALHYYLCNQFIKMLAQTGSYDTNARVKFKTIKSQFRDVLLAVSQQSGSSKLLIDYEESLDTNHLGRRSFNFYGSEYYDNFLDKELDVESLANINPWLKSLIDELEHFRRHYLVRFSKAKVKNAIEKVAKNCEQIISKLNIKNSVHRKTINKLQQVVEERSALEGINEGDIDILQISALHGTNTGIFASLPMSGYELMNTGKLNEFNITPFSGELCVGAFGVNNSSISTVPFSGMHLAMRYTINHYFDSKATVRQVKSFVQEMELKLAKNNLLFKKIGDCYHTASFAKFIFSFKRLLRIHPPLDLVSADEWTELMDIKIPAILKRIKNDFEIFKCSKEYRKYMPKTEDPSGNRGYKYHDYSYFNDLHNIESFIKQLEAILHSNHETINFQESKYLNNPAPLLISTENTYAKGRGNFSVAERNVFCNMAFGREVKAVFVNDSDIPQVNSYFTSNGIHNIAVRPFSSIEKAYLYEIAAAPFFADILSRRKLSILSNPKNKKLYRAKPILLKNPITDEKRSGHMLAKIQLRVQAIQNYQHLKRKIIISGIGSSLAIAGSILLSPILASIAITCSLLASGAALFWSYRKTKIKLTQDHQNEIYRNFVLALNSDNEKQSYRTGYKSQSDVQDYIKSYLKPSHYSPQYYLGLTHAKAQQDNQLNVGAKKLQLR